MLLEPLLQLGAPHDPDFRGSSDLLADALAVSFRNVVIREQDDASRLVSKEDLQPFRSDEFGRDRLARTSYGTGIRRFEREEDGRSQLLEGFRCEDPVALPVGTVQNGGRLVRGAGFERQL